MAASPSFSKIGKTSKTCRGPIGLSSREDPFADRGKIVSRSDRFSQKWRARPRSHAAAQQPRGCGCRLLSSVAPLARLTHSSFTALATFLFLHTISPRFRTPSCISVTQHLNGTHTEVPQSSTGSAVFEHICKFGNNQIRIKLESPGNQIKGIAKRHADQDIDRQCLIAASHPRWRSSESLP